MLLGADSMFGANTMDGKFKVFTNADLSQTYKEEKKSLREQFYVELPYGVTCIDYFSLDGGEKELIVAGLDDGSLQIYDYKSNKSK